ncbi:MAG: hypothetical protein VKJ24_02190 [Synechococcales bacterium]|nr:hypothetical protein [Synechococcales bacterium]
MHRNVFLLNVVGLGFLLLGACSNGQPQAQPTPTPSPVASTPAAAPAKTEGKSTATGHDATHKSVGGIVVESGVYHLELLPLQEGDGIHLDFFLQKGETHEAIPGAKVSAQVQLPDGSQQTIDLPYDASGKHYAGKISSNAAGEYKVVVQSEIAGEKVNARYRFKQ